MPQQLYSLASLLELCTTYNTLLRTLYVYSSAQRTVRTRKEGARGVPANLAHCKLPVYLPAKRYFARASFSRMYMMSVLSFLASFVYFACEGILHRSASLNIGIVANLAISGMCLAVSG